ncbi:hypothetical protein [Mucilaginibacter aquaedulcis]|uniref:hypothetical protein n=1 Tax=Mucilaginibacter aquaedulcis TaxID=1187081 RepID=UPI0025B33476|nr:hypothetical protein [Mucilaginibacter aquaedulcis]MDN3550131.1 hypothetical protein [Mucilaginibacter aquaedulcis]
MEIIFYVTHAAMLICIGGILWSVLSGFFYGREVQNVQSSASNDAYVKPHHRKVITGLYRAAVSLIVTITRLYITN